MKKAKVFGTVLTISIVTTIAAALLYWLDLPVFNANVFAWILVIGIVASAAAAATLIIQSIWNDGRYS